MKIGDWVKFISNKPNNYCDGEILQITNIDDRGFCHFGDYNKLYSIDLLELWQPTEGEWCWSKYDGLVQILKITDERYIVFPLSTSKKDCTIEYRLGGLEPFIGELPSFIKDKQ